ncbi:MAG TPA: magnesium/cobalt transporter CorA [Isosphaeraceae bacterium]|jgi:magnesium transporter|nr:magnesium/cobalt transporter CorA [Isosphaeraceae bacterium]
MATATAEPPKRTTPGATVRVVHRSSAGAIDHDWPVDRIAEALRDAGGTTWVDVLDPGPDHSATEALFRDVFAFHPLAIDDALHESHVPKVDDWDRYLYTVFHAIDYDRDTGDLRLHELDFFLGINFLVSYHTEPLVLLDRLRQAIARDDGNRLRRGPDHLLYNALDLGVDDYMGVIERLDDAIDDAQDEVFHRPTPHTLHEIFRIKRAALRMHRVLSPQREVLNRLARDQYAQIDAPDRVYFRDVYDHLVRLHDITEGLRDLISGALDTYLSALSNRTNDIMKTLTFVTVLFLPMTFLAGFFGMNFFGDNIVLSAPLPRVALFWVTCVLMLATPWALWTMARKRGWF